MGHEAFKRDDAATRGTRAAFRVETKSSLDIPRVVIAEPQRFEFPALPIDMRHPERRHQKPTQEKSIRRVKSEDERKGGLDGVVPEQTPSSAEEEETSRRPLHPIWRFVINIPTVLGFGGMALDVYAMKAGLALLHSFLTPIALGLLAVSFAKSVEHLLRTGIYFAGQKIANLGERLGQDWEKMRNPGLLQTTFVERYIEGPLLSLPGHVLNGIGAVLGALARVVLAAPGVIGKGLWEGLLWGAEASGAGVRLGARALGGIWKFVRAVPPTIGDGIVALSGRWKEVRRRRAERKAFNASSKAHMDQNFINTIERLIGTGGNYKAAARKVPFVHDPAIRSELCERIITGMFPYGVTSGITHLGEGHLSRKDLKKLQGFLPIAQNLVSYVHDLSVRNDINLRLTEIRIAFAERGLGKENQAQSGGFVQKIGSGLKRWLGKRSENEYSAAARSIGNIHGNWNPWSKASKDARTMRDDARKQIIESIYSYDRINLIPQLTPIGINLFKGKLAFAIGVARDIHDDEVYNDMRDRLILVRNKLIGRMIELGMNIAYDGSLHTELKERGT